MTEGEYLLRESWVSLSQAFGLGCVDCDEASSALNSFY